MSPHQHGMAWRAWMLGIGIGIGVDIPMDTFVRVHVYHLNWYPQSCNCMHGEVELGFEVAVGRTQDASCHQQQRLLVGFSSMFCWCGNGQRTGGRLVWKETKT